MDAVVALLKSMDFEKLIPNLGFYLFSLKFWGFVLVMAGPAVLFVLGRLYARRPPESPDSFWAYRTKAAMQDRRTWEKTHSIAGKSFTRLGTVMGIAGLAVSFFVFVLPTDLSAALVLIAVVAQLVVIAAARRRLDGQIKNM